MKAKIEGYIVANDEKAIYEFWGYTVTCPNDIKDLIEKAKGKPIDIEITTCYGGDVWAGSDIYTALKDYKGGVSITITGLAASAASIIAMAGHCKMSPTAQMLIHNAQLIAEGDYHDMEKAAEVGKVACASIVNAYVLKTGMSVKDMLAVMDNETWLTAQKALDMKLVDEIMFADSGVRLAASFGATCLPVEVIQKTRAILAERAQVQTKAETPEDTQTIKPVAVDTVPELDNEIERLKLVLQAQM